MSVIESPSLMYIIIITLIAFFLARKLRDWNTTIVIRIVAAEKAKSKKRVTFRENVDIFPYDPASSISELNLMDREEKKIKGDT